MRKSTFLIAGLVIVSVLGLFLMTNSFNREANPRLVFEKFLNEQQIAKQNLSVEEMKSLPKLDRPDLAGYADFRKVVDPAIQTVPSWRTLEAFNEIRNKPSSFKSAQDELNWTAHPTDMGGRTRALMFDPNDPTHSKVWAGSVTGGLWSSLDPFHNIDWLPVNDFMPNLSISCLAYDPNNTNIFFAGTGESQTALIIYRESSGRGSGIMKSTDEGETWNIIPSTSEWAYVTDIVVRDEEGQSVIYAGVVSGYYKGGLHSSQPSDGLYRSTDGGDSWAQVLPLIPGANIPYAPSDIVMSSDNQRIFVGTTYHGEERRGAACILHSDNGIDWTVNDTYNNLIEAETTNKFPGRVMMCNAPSNPDIIFALVASGYERINSHQHDDYVGYDCKYLLKSIDKGQTWTQLTPSPGFAYLAWHALVIQVSPVNPNVIWLGGLDTHRSTDGGSTWTKMSSWGLMQSSGDNARYVHADIHVYKFRPGSDSDMIVATDGGIFTTANAPATNVAFSEANDNYSTLQYYSGAIHPQAGSEHFIGGLQDNGTMSYRKNHIPTHGDMLSGGDGALCFIDEDTPDLHITTVYHNIIYTYSGELEQKPHSLRGNNAGTGTFINPMDYNSRDNILFANEQDWEGNNANRLLIAGITTSAISFQHLDLDTESSVPFSCLKWSEHSPSGQSNLFIGTESGRFFKLPDASRSGVSEELTPTDFPTGFISSIDIGQTEDTLLVTFSNYGVESVWYSTDGGENWINKEGNLPDIPVRWSLFHPKNGNQVMLATELGIWTTNNIQAEPVVWTQNIAGLATVRVDMIKFRKSDNTVLAATHGRGMFSTVWSVDYSSYVLSEELNSKLTFFPNPSNGEFQIEFLPDSQTVLMITDMAGRLVFQEEFQPTQTLVTKSIDLSDQPKGLYLVKLESISRKKFGKLLIQ